VLAVIGLTMNLGLSRLEARPGRWQVRAP
jgi:hypothetical protein